MRSSCGMGLFLRAPHFPFCPSVARNLAGKCNRFRRSLRESFGKTADGHQVSSPLLSEVRQARNRENSHRIGAAPPTHSGFLWLRSLARSRGSSGWSDRANSRPRVLVQPREI
jgi:hypothetical protein